MLHLLDGLLERNDVGDFEERRLHDGIGTRTQAELGGDLRGVDDVEIDVVLRQVSLHVVGQGLAGGLGVVHGVQEERTALLETLQHIVLVDVRRHVASHEVGRSDQIGRSDGQVAETQVRRRVTARLLGIVREISLAILVGGTADNLDGVLVGTHRTVGAQTEEEGLERTGLGERNLLADGQRQVGHVVVDADGEVVLGLSGGQVLEDGEHLGGRGVLGRKTVAAADDHGLKLLAVEHRLDVEVQRLTLGAGLLGAVEDADALDRSGHDVEEILLGERTVEVDGDKTDLLALLEEEVDGLLEGLGDGTHGDDDVLGIGSTVVGERLVLASGNLRNLFHGVADHVGHGVVELVGRLAGLEIDVGILGRTARDGMLGIEGAAAELLERVAVEHGGEGGLVDELDFLNLMRSAEPVEEMEERHTRLERHDMGDTGEVHDLLHRRGGEHGETGLPGGHDVLVVAEDGERLGGERTGRNVEDAGEQLARNLVHIGDHQQQALRRGERRSEGAALQRTVHGAGGTGLRLHLDDLHRLAEDVPATLGGPLVDELGHGRRRRDGVNRRNLREHVSHMSRSVVAIARNEFLFCHIELNLENIYLCVFPNTFYSPGTAVPEHAMQRYE